VRGGLGEVPAEAEQDANGVQQGGDALGHGPAGVIRLRILGWVRTGCGGFHGSINNRR